MTSMVMALALVACRSAPRPATATVIAPDPEAALGGDWHVCNRRIEIAEIEGLRALRLDDGRGMGLVWDPALTLGEGEIECHVRGRDLAGKSFVGLAFHVLDDAHFEAVYLRPFNFRSPDPVRHAHALQYVTEPEHPWDQLRRDHPGAYEAAVVPEPDPSGWVHLRLALRAREVRVYVNGSAQPALTVESLGEARRGGVGFWVGDESNGDFAGLRITPSGAEARGSP